MADTIWEVVVVGAGAAGLLAAIRAAECGRRVLLLEKNRKPGVKILMSGGTRCNLTHATDEAGIVAAYGPPGRFLHSALAALSVQETIDLFEAEGVAVKVEETGKIFPVSNKALDVLEALLRRLRRSGATLALEQPVRELQPDPPGFALTTPGGGVRAGRVVLTTGGQSYPGSGTTGDGYAFARRLGHTIVPPRPALTPVAIDAPWATELRGVTLPDVGVRVMEGKTVLQSGRGSLLFAHFGLSGPVVLDLSRVVSGHPEPKSLALEIDLLPGWKEHDLDEWLRVETAASGKKQLAAVFSSQLPRRLCDAVLPQAGLRVEQGRGPEPCGSRPVGELLETAAPAGNGDARVRQGGGDGRRRGPGGSRFPHHAQQDCPPPLYCRRITGPRRTDRRIQLSGRMEHGMARRRRGGGR